MKKNLLLLATLACTSFAFAQTGNRIGRSSNPIEVPTNKTTIATPQKNKLADKNIKTHVVPKSDFDVKIIRKKDEYRSVSRKAITLFPSNSQFQYEKSTVAIAIGGTKIFVNQ